MGKIKCELCGKSGKNPCNFREVIGNVFVPVEGGPGGLIGQNIFDDESEWSGTKEFIRIEKVLIEQGKIPVSLDDGKLRIYSSIFCVSCYLKASGISPNGKNKLRQNRKRVK